MPRALGHRLVPVLFPTRQRWRADDARAVLDRIKSSGLSVRAFAAREGLSVQRLYRWRRELRLGKAARPGFVEVRPLPTASGTAIEVALRSGYVLRVRSGFGEEDLRRLVAVLEERDSQC